MLGTILRNADIITLALDIGTYMRSLDLSFDGSNDGNIEILLQRDSLGYTYYKVLGSD